MIKYNLIMILDKNEENVLMCYRSKDPYKGKYNLVGGKIDEGETYLESAYRELFEETGIQKNDVTLHPFIDYTWYPASTKMKVFIGRLTKEVSLVEEIHQLKWVSLQENFFNMEAFAGEGNIGHMVRIYQMYKDELFK